MRTKNTRRPLLATLGLLSVAGLTLTGCGWAEDIGDSLDSSNSKEHQVDTGAEGKESGLLAAWVPDEARDVSVMQRTTGSERLLTFTYDGGVPPDCLEIETTGAPTEEELEEAYATDLRTAEFAVDDWTTTPTLEADWWTPGQEDSTTHLCMRWWVSEDGGTFHAFAADQR